MKRQAGFTLIEVVVAVAILGVSLTVLLQSQASSLNNAGRSRDMTVAALLARGKMIDIEKHLFHDGFQMTTEDEKGDFTDEGHNDVAWEYRISEVELDLSALSSLCGMMASKKEKTSKGGEDKTADCESMMSGLGSTVGAFTDEIGRSLRVIDLKVTWPQGRYHESMSVRALVSRDDFATVQESDTQKMINQATGGQGVGGQTPAGGTAAPAAGGVLR